MPPFSRVVRFAASNGDVYYGDASGLSNTDDLVGTEVYVYTDAFEPGMQLSRVKKRIATVLSPIAKATHIYGVGLNYRAHAEEADLPIPEYPMIFSKPVDALAGPFENIPVDKECTLLDYEGELCVIIGKDCKNIASDENPLDYVLGYCVANDVSSRYWQMPERAGQAGYAKGFDKFAPIGPVLVSPSILTDIGKHQMTTKVNGEQRQVSYLNDLIFDVPILVRHLSRGMTLRKFTVILTGTPSGVGALMKPPAWLKDGDVVSIEIDGIGKISNKMQFS